LLGRSLKGLAKPSEQTDGTALPEECAATRQPAHIIDNRHGSFSGLCIMSWVRKRRWERCSQPAPRGLFFCLMGDMYWVDAEFLNELRPPASVD
jgi:hypothetical protein